MQYWYGSAGICLNEENKLLMVLQGKEEEVKRWAVPAGGLEPGETYIECCQREMEEETGYKAEITKLLKIKKQMFEEENFLAEVHYFLVRKVGGNPVIQDPDNLIHEIGWKSAEEISILSLCFPEDREFLLSCIEEFSISIPVKII